MARRRRRLGGGSLGDGGKTTGLLFGAAVLAGVGLWYINRRGINILGRRGGDILSNCRCGYYCLPTAGRAECACYPCPF